MKETNHLKPEFVLTLDGPQISMWIVENKISDLLLLNGKGTQWFLANSQIWPWNLEISTLTNNSGYSIKG